MEIACKIISHKQTSFKVRVESFKNKMNTWKPGRVLCSKYFNVNGVKLRFELNPNGDDKEDLNHISFFIRNESSVAIDLLCDIHMGSKIEWEDVNLHIKAEDN